MRRSSFRGLPTRISIATFSLCNNQQTFASDSKEQLEICAKIAMTLPTDLRSVQRSTYFYLGLLVVFAPKTPPIAEAAALASQLQSTRSWALYHTNMRLCFGQNQRCLENYLSQIQHVAKPATFVGKR
jgi:hypothetical protein